MAAKPMLSGGLSAASNPSARLQELLRSGSATSDKNTEKNVEESTELHAEKKAEISTEKNTPSHTEVRSASYPQESTETLPSSYTELPPSTRMYKHKPAKVEAKASSSISIRQRIVEDLQKEPVVRKTIDIPASLNERLQNYCAAKRIKTERRVFLVLLENFLEEEGF